MTVFIVIRSKSWMGSELTDIIDVFTDKAKAQKIVDEGNVNQKKMCGDWLGQWHYGIVQKIAQ